MDIISRFDLANAQKAHGDTILAGAVLPDGLHSPFDHAWGYLNGPGAISLNRKYRTGVLPAKKTRMSATFSMIGKTKGLEALFLKSLWMEHRGFEPLTSTMRTLRATNCANAPYVSRANSRVILPRFTSASLETFSIMNGVFRIYINWSSPSQL